MPFVSNIDIYLLKELQLSLDHVSSVLPAMLRSYIYVAFNDSSPSSLIYLPI